MLTSVSASYFTPTKAHSDTAQQGSRTQHQSSLPRGGMVIKAIGNAEEALETVSGLS